MWADPDGWLFQANLKKFMEYVQLHNTEKVARLLDKGLDPNFAISSAPRTGKRLTGVVAGGWGHCPRGPSWVRTVLGTGRWSWA